MPPPPSPKESVWLVVASDGVGSVGAAPPEAERGARDGESGGVGALSMVVVFAGVVVASAIDAKIKASAPAKAPAKRTMSALRERPRRG